MSPSDEPDRADTGSLRIALAQINTTVGDIVGNAQRISRGLADASAAGAELVLFPELALTGYPPEDLLLKEHFLRDARIALDELARETEGIVAIVGAPERAEDVFNAAAVLAEGRLAGFYRKVYLPNYGVFDEQRYFQSGNGGALLELGEHRIGLTVCEDMWEPGPPASDEALAGATLLVNVSASPYHVGKGLERERMFAQRARDNGAAVAFCALVGGQDELIFDGHSCVIDHTGEVIARASQFEEELLVCDVDLRAAGASRLRDAGYRPAARRARPEIPVIARLPRPRPTSDAGPPARRVAELLRPEEAEVYAALTLGLRDYVEKNGFAHVVLGLSGGIDSALVACVAVDALGPERVTLAIMPSPHSSDETQADARGLAAALGTQPFELPIEAVMRAYDETLRDAFDGLPGRPHRGERPGPDPGQPADGALQQVRLARAHHRQQVGDVGRLHDALRRPRRRLRSHQGRAQDARLPPRALAQLARRIGRPDRGTDPGLDHRTRTLGRAAPGAARRGLAATLPRARSHPARLRRARSGPRGAHLRRAARGRRRSHDPSRRARRIQAPPGTTGDQGDPARVRARPAHADHEPLSRLSDVTAGCAARGTVVAAGALQLRSMSANDIAAMARFPPGSALRIGRRGEFFVRDSAGSGPAVLLLHGWMVSADLNWGLSYGPLIDAGYRVVALDHRGHGRGLRTLAPFRLSDCADDAAAVVRALGCGPISAVGYSMGGPIAALLARDHPELVSGLVFCATATNWQEPPMRRFWRTMGALQLALSLSPVGLWRAILRRWGIPDSELTDWLVAELTRGSARDLAEAGRELGRFDAGPWIGSLAAPSAVVLTSRDRSVPPRLQRQLAASRQAPVFEVPADHFAVSQATERFNAELLQALAAVAASAARADDHGAAALSA